MRELTDMEKLEIAVALLDDCNLAVYAGICQKREAGCPSGLCAICQLTECPYERED